jgi:replicative DNA helicase
MSADLEELILGCVLDAESPAVNSSAATLIEGSGLRGDDLTNVRVRHAWTIAQRLASRAKPVDATTVYATGRATRTFSDGDLPWLQRLAASNACDAPRFSVLVEQVRSQARASKLRAVLTSALGDLDGSKADLAAAQGRLEAALALLSQTSSDDPTADSDVYEIAADWQRQEEGADPPSVVPTGIAPLDDVIVGWQPNLNVVCGLPSTGKSALLASVLDAQTSAGVPVGLFGLEDGSRWVAERVLARDLGIALSDVGRRGRLGELGERFADVAQRLTNQLKLLTVYRYDSVTIDELCRRGAAWVATRGVRSIYVDHGGEVDHNATQADEFRLKVAESYRRLRGLALTTRCPVVTLAHTVRPSDENEERPPRTSEIAESAYIERRARLVLGVWARSDEADHVRVSVLKNTRGVRGVHLKLKRHTTAALVSTTDGEVVSLVAEQRDRAQAAAVARAEARAKAKEATDAVKAQAKASRGPAQRGMFGTEGRDT